MVPFCYRTVVLSVRLSVSPVCNVAVCGQMVGWIKMKLGTQVGQSPGHIVLDGDPAPSFPKGPQPFPQISAHMCCGQMAAGWIDATWYGGKPQGDFVIEGDLRL